MTERTYADYLPARTPWGRWWQRHRRPSRRDDRRNYVGWTAVSTGHTDEEPWPSVGARGRIEAAEKRCGELVHHLVFSQPSDPRVPWYITVPLPWKGIRLEPPGR